MLAELASLRDDVNMPTAIVQRLDNSHRPNDPTSPMLIRTLRKAGAAVTAATAAPALSQRPRCPAAASPSAVFAPLNVSGNA
jgi:hypothetical protein